MARKLKQNKDPKKGGHPLEWTDERIDKLCDDILEMIKNEDVITFLEVQAALGFGYEQQCEFELRHPRFAETKSHMRKVIGARREKFALRGAINHNLVAKHHALYCNELRAYERECRNAESHQAQQIIVQGIRGLAKAQDIDQQAKNSNDK